VIGFSDVLAAGEPYRVYTLETATQVIQIAQAQSARRRMAGQLALRAVLPVALLAPMLMLIVWWVVGRAVAPVDRLRRQLAARAAGDLAPLPVAGLPAEVAPLVAEMNGLLARLDAAWRQLQATSPPTPRTSCARPWPRCACRCKACSAPPEARQRATERLLAGVDRATRLVEQLLALARHDGDGVAAASAPVDLMALARRAVHDAMPEAQTRQIELRGPDEGAAELPVQARPTPWPCCCAT
jgi:two-component system OmpR family sensor kinase